VDDLRRQLIGAWRVKRYDDRASTSEEWVETFGPNVDGLIVSHESGWLSVQVVDSDGKLDSYFGRFEVIEIQEVDGDASGLLHHLILASSLPELLTADPARPFRVSADALVLGDEQTWRRICERVG
jgi:hypothetical protein